MTGDDPLPPLREVIKAHGLSAEKSLGQNFLLDLNLTRRIARVAAPLDGHVILEVGPGPGGLTRAVLMEGADHVVAVERDRRCAPVLAAIAEAFDHRLTGIEGDALAVDIASHIPAGHAGKPVKIIANLPYNVGTQLFLNWVAAPKWPPFFASLTLMFQREVADRITAAPGSKAYGRLSVLAQWRATVRRALSVPAAAFTPPPKVDSAIVHLVPRAPMDSALDLASLERVTEAAFTQRRKMLRASLKSLGGDTLALLSAADIDPTARAEALNVADFVRLARTYQDEKF